VGIWTTAKCSWAYVRTNSSRTNSHGFDHILWHPVEDTVTCFIIISMHSLWIKTLIFFDAMAPTGDRRFQLCMWCDTHRLAQRSLLTL
jgi:hypothetical protein